MTIQQCDALRRACALLVLCFIAIANNDADALASPWIRPNVQSLLGPISPSTLETYILPRDVVTNGWSAQLVSRTAKSYAEGTDVELVPKNPGDHFVDGFRCEIPIPNLDSPGLGVELLELEGGRDDGLGITIVNGLVPGGNAERALATSERMEKDEPTIMYGDAIIGAELILQRAGGKTDVITAKTECLGYESTVAALVDMLGQIHSGDGGIREASVVLTLKRLLRRPEIRVKVQYPPSQGLESETLRLNPGDNLRLAMLQRGVKLNDPLARRYDGKESGGNCGGERRASSSSRASLSLALFFDDFRVCVPRADPRAALSYTRARALPYLRKKHRGSPVSHVRRVRAARGGTAVAAEAEREEDAGGDGQRGAVEAFVQELGGVRHAGGRRRDTGQSEAVVDAEGPLWVEGNVCKSRRSRNKGSA